MTRLVVVLVGTDHHPFPRLVDWADEVALRHPEVHVLVQHGASRAPRVAEGRAYLAHADLRALLARASAAVCHGGPGTIMDARGAGHVPVCVPRDPALGEHVDGHQLRFARLVHRAGVVTTVATAEELHVALDAVLARPECERRHTVPTSEATDAARSLLCRELDGLLAGGVRHGPHQRRLRVPVELPLRAGSGLWRGHP